MFSILDLLMNGLEADDLVELRSGTPTRMPPAPKAHAQGDRVAVERRLSLELPFFIAVGWGSTGACFACHESLGTRIQAAAAAFGLLVLGIPGLGKIIRFNDWSYYHMLRMRCIAEKSSQLFGAVGAKPGQRSLLEMEQP
jgi:hypothetical protein